MSSISATINGAAALVPTGSEEEAYYRQQHLENNTFVDGSGGEVLQRVESGGVASQDGGEGRFVAGEEVRVIVVSMRDVRISDWKGQVRDWVLVPAEGGRGSAAPVVNGIRPGG